MSLGAPGSEAFGQSSAERRAFLYHVVVFPREAVRSGQRRREVYTIARIYDSARMDSLAPLGKDQLAYLRRRAARDGRTEQRPGTSGPSGAVCRIFEFSSLPQGHGSSEMVDGPRGMARLYTNSKKSKWRLRETLTFPDGAIVDGAAPGERVVSINLPPGASRLVVARQGSRGDRRRGCQPRYTYTLVDLLVREFVRATWSQHATSPGSADTANCDAITSDTAKLSVGDGCSIIAGGAGDPGRCAEGSAQSRAPQFVDAEFPPELASLAPDGHSKQVEWEGIVWKRPPEIFGDRNFCLFDEAIVPNGTSLAGLTFSRRQPHRYRFVQISFRDTHPIAGCLQLCLP